MRRRRTSPRPANLGCPQTLTEMRTSLKWRRDTKPRPPLSEWLFPGRRTMFDRANNIVRQSCKKLFRCPRYSFLYHCYRLAGKRTSSEFWRNVTKTCMYPVVIDGAKSMFHCSSAARLAMKTVQVLSRGPNLQALDAARPCLVKLRSHRRKAGKLSK